MSVPEALAEAKKRGLDCVSFVDHDTTAGTAEALALGSALGIQVIPGVEISAYDFRRSRKVHILGYSYTLPAPAIRKLCDPILRARDAMTVAQIGILRAAGYPVSVEEVRREAGNAAGSTATLYKQHIMALLCGKKLADGYYGETYRKIFKNGGICDLEIVYADVFGAVRAVREDGGYAILAHPGQLDSWDIIDELVDAGLDGIELFHEDHDGTHRRLVRKAKARHPHLILTGGSDDHGVFGSEHSMGEIVAPAGVGARLRPRNPTVALTGRS